MLPALATGSLILLPPDPLLLLPAEPLLARLRELELCADTLADRPGRLAIGPAFMQWISFAGCSAFIRFAPESAEDEAFCHLRLQQVEAAQPQFLSSSQTKPPTCPHCRKALLDWQPLMRQWQRDRANFPCPHCAQAIDPLGLNWRRHAGLGRTWVEIFNIFPGEARPVPGLLQQLGALSGGQDWGYCYL
jgi:hypothetical protein